MARPGARDVVRRHIQPVRRQVERAERLAQSRENVRVRLRAIVTLRTAPTAPKHFMPGDGQPPSAAGTDHNSPATAGSSPNEGRSRDGAAAAEAPIFPSAHAACPRTSGSSSESASTSAGASSASP